MCRFLPVLEMSLSRPNHIHACSFFIEFIIILLDFISNLLVGVYQILHDEDLVIQIIIHTVFYTCHIKY